MSKPAPLATTPAPNTFAADYPSLFGDQGIDLCPDEAFESRFGPFAYADSLLVTARRLEAKVGQPPESPLASRRRDIPDLLLDEPALNRRVPRLALAVECLEALVAQVLRSKRQHPWQLLRQTDEDYPDFSHRTIVNASMRNALTLCTGLAPAQLRALQATQATSDGALWTRLGWPADSTVAGLADSVTFLSLTA